MTEQTPSPLTYDLPHDKWRLHQYETLQLILSTTEPGKVTIVSAPTGSGKTTFPAAVGKSTKVIALTETKALQQQYADQYKFTELFGKANYACLLGGANAGSCKHKKNPRECPRHNYCPYYSQKRKAMDVNRTALNYAYYLSTNWPREFSKTSWLFLDECHLLPDVVIEHASTTISEKQRREYGLSEFPIITTKGQSMFFQNVAEDKAAEWLEGAVDTLSRKVNVLNLRAERNPTLNDERDKAEQLYRDLENTLVALQSAPDDWFIRSGRGALDDGASGFVARPLTARHHFPRQFLHGGPVVLMSATVGNFATFATELGIKEYGSIEVPNQWEPEARPVYVWKDAPKLGRKANEAAWEQQADIIARMIKEVPATWSGVIHTTSKVQTDRLHAMLADRGLQERLWKTPATGTNNQLHHWQLVKNRFRYQGMIALAWSWHNGVDLGDERICIAAKTPFGSLSSDYDRERMHYDGKFYLQQTAWELQQMCGRTRRGRVQDYDADGQRAGLVAIVDGNWHRVNNYLDASFREAITEWN